MEKRLITQTLMEAFCAYLVDQERSPATIGKYMRDIRHFVHFAAGQALSRQLMLAYKADVSSKYAVASANSMLAAINALLRFAGWGDLCLKQFKLQRQVYTPEEKELTRTEYERLVATAQKRGNERLCLILQTIEGRPLCSARAKPARCYW